jgi:uncharacterized membrane protein
MTSNNLPPVKVVQQGEAAMSDTPVELIVSAFSSEHAAEERFNELVAAKKEHLVKIRAAATIRRDGNGKLHINERGDVGTAGGAASGAALGAVVGLFGGPIGAVLGAGAGALIGGLAARLIDSGIPDDRLRELGDALTPNSSAIVALVEHTWVDEFKNALATAGGNLMASTITADVANQLAAGHDVTYSAIGGAGGLIAASRTTFEKAKDAAGDAAHAVANTVDDAVDATRDAASDATKAVANTVDDAVDATRDAASDATKAVANTVDDAVDATRDVATNAADAVADTVDDAKDAVKKATS